MKTTMERVWDHYNEALDYFPDDRVVGCFLQGSQNYELDIETSDVDTKLIVTPTFEDIAMNKKPVSTTHVRANDEHIDWKDIRLYIQTFRKQNLNFLEILFTPYFLLDPLYENEWNRLVTNREAIANFNRYRGVQSMKGVALEKYHAMEHPYPSKIHLIEKYGYDGKQVSHLLRIYDFITRYIQGEEYEKCLIPSKCYRDRIMAYKLNLISLDEARCEALKLKEKIERMAEEFYAVNENVENPEINALLDDVQLNIMRIAIEKELK